MVESTYRHEHLDDAQDSHQRGPSSPAVAADSGFGFETIRPPDHAAARDGARTIALVNEDAMRRLVEYAGLHRSIL